MNTEMHAILELAREISEHPSMFADTPEVAHGMLEGLSWIVLSKISGQPFERSVRDALPLIRSATSDVGHVRGQLPLLCDETTYPRRTTSFEAFQRHSRSFLRLLEAAVADSEAQ